MVSLLAEKILIIGYVWPEPNSSAAGTRMMQLIHLLLAQDCELCFASPAKLGEHQIDLSTLGIQQQEILLNDASFDTFLADFLPGLVIFDRFMMEEQFGWRVEKTCPEALRILNTEDLHCLRDVRGLLLKSAVQQNRLNNRLFPLEALNPESLEQSLKHSELAIREISAILRCDLTLMISAFETQLLQTLFQIPEKCLFTLPFMYEKASPAHLPSYEERQHFVCIGNFRHAPNWDAVLTLKQLWPQIRQALPQAQLHIYGAYPPKKATQLHNSQQGFLVKGWAEDATEVIKNARVMLAPLRFGAGIKGKLAEAMQNGTPSVTTLLGAESMMGAQGQWNGVICDTENDFINAAIQLYQTPKQWQLAQQQGFELFNEHYAQYQLPSQFWQRLQDLKAHLNQERTQNFTGQMLRHHLHKSTHYMALWIEAKNKSEPLAN